ncbi:MAG: metallopeptidase TldD-related protein [Elusimicrobiota bacterium]
MTESILSQIKGILNKKKLTAWQIRQMVQTSFQSFLALTEEECRRTVSTTIYIISLYKKRVDKEGKETLGLSQFKIGPQDLAQLEKLIDNALFSANLVSNIPFHLPGQPSKLPDVEIYDQTLNGSSLIDFSDRIQSCVSKEKNIRLSAAEFFINKTEVRQINHCGLDVTQEDTSIHTEFILLAKSEKGENEFINRYTRRFLTDFKLEEEIAQSAQFARDATLASLPKTGDYPVLISDEPLDHLFNPIIAKTSARLKFNHMVQSNIGDSILDGTAVGDSITLYSNGLISQALGTNRFDSYGVPTNKTLLVENNIIKNYLADVRYGSYLNLPITGEIGNVEVLPGSQSFQSLISSHPVLYHLQAFSAFEPNAITGAFSAEIRAGYEISSQGVRPIKGGSVSGVLQKALLDCYLSQERVQRERVLVPKGILFSHLTLAGN